MGMYLGQQKVRIIERSKSQLIPFPYLYMYNDYEKGGITWRMNADGSVTANGTSTGVTSVMLFAYRDDILKPNKTYTLSGSPVNRNELNVMLYISVTKDGAYVREHYDTGNGVTFTTEEGHVYGLTLWIGAGVTVKNLTFYPMLNEGTVTKPYEPFNRYFRIRTGANVRNPANLIPFPYAEQSKTEQGVDWIVNNDGSISVNGIPANYTAFVFSREIPVEYGKTYTFSIGGKTLAEMGLSGNMYGIREDGSQVDYNPSAYATSKTFTILDKSVKRLDINIKRLGNNTPISGTVYPMLFEGETTKPYYIQD